MSDMNRPAEGPAKPRYFVSISNIRTGSTHLATTLNRLPGVSCDYEAKWRPSYATTASHLPLGPGDDIRSVLTRVLPAAPVMGTKLVLDPYLDNVIPLEEEEELLACFPPEIKVVHLIRPYFDILLSNFGRDYSAGVMHLRNRDVDDQSTLARHAAGTGAAIPERTAVDSFHGYVWFLLLLLNNDLIAHRLSGRVEQSYLLPYGEIDGRLPELATFLGIPADPERLAEVVARPVMRKLKRPDPSRIPGHESLQVVAARLEMILYRYLSCPDPEDRPLVIFRQPGPEGGIGVRSNDPGVIEVLGLISG